VDSISLALLVLPAALFLSFFMSGMEAGIQALSPIRIRHWVRTGRPRAQLLDDLLKNPEDFLWTILVGNTLANVTVVSLIVLFLHTALAHRPLLALALFLPAILLFYAFCDLLPKMLFRRRPNRLCLRFVSPFRLLHASLSPLVRILAWFSRTLQRSQRSRSHSARLFGTRDELRLVIEESDQALTSEERRMIGRVLDLPTLQVSQFAKPLNQLVSVQSSTPMAEVLQLCRDRHLTRLPVWRESPPNPRIAGIVSLQRLLYRTDLDMSRAAGAYLKPALYLSDQLTLEAALRQMQRSGQRLAIVLGPHHRETGLLSLEDILQVIFGDVRL
jgi:CBS domain containing-hemolysin-like protein